MSLEPKYLHGTIGESWALASVGYSLDELEEKSPEQLLERPLDQYTKVMETLEYSGETDYFSVVELLDGINDLQSENSSVPSDSFYQDLTIMEVKGLIDPMEESEHGLSPHLYCRTEKMRENF